MPSAAYPVEEVEGIGPSYGAKLKKAGISTTYELLDKCAKKSGRKSVAADTGISEKLILEWTNLADLMRVKGEIQLVMCSCSLHGPYVEQW